MSVYWCYRGALSQAEPPPPYRVEVASAADPQEACRLFGLKWPSSLVHEVGPRSRFDLASGEPYAEPAPGGVVSLAVVTLPSYYDRFERF